LNVIRVYQADLESVKRSAPGNAIGANIGPDYSTFGIGHLSFAI